MSYRTRLLSRVLQTQNIAYWISRIVRMHFIFVHFVSGSFHTKIQMHTKSWKQVMKESETAYETAYESLVRTNYSGFTVWAILEWKPHLSRSRTKKLKNCTEALAFLHDSSVHKNLRTAFMLCTDYQISRQKQFTATKCDWSLDFS